MTNLHTLELVTDLTNHILKLGWMFFTPDDLFDDEPEDSLNDETFGSGAIVDDRWEEQHQYLSKSFDIPRHAFDIDDEVRTCQPPNQDFASLSDLNPTLNGTFKCN